jgi:predicted NBD/HSP70 family sugar kinase
VLATVWFGPGTECRNQVVITVSEGIGTGLLTNGKLLRGWNGMAGEFGHVSLDPDGPECSCGNRGCWEVFASHRAALRYYQESTATELTFQDLLALAESSDVLALKALDRMARAVGRGMRMILAGLAPEEIVVVGEFTRLWRRYGPVIEAEVAKTVLVGKPPRVRPAEGREARLRGTVALVLQKHFGPAWTEYGKPNLGERESQAAIACLQSDQWRLAQRYPKEISDAEFDSTPHDPV